MLSKNKDYSNKDRYTMRLKQYVSNRNKKRKMLEEEYNKKGRISKHRKDFIAK